MNWVAFFLPNRAYLSSFIDRVNTDFRYIFTNFVDRTEEKKCDKGTPWLCNSDYLWVLLGNSMFNGVLIGFNRKITAPRKMNKDFLHLLDYLTCSHANWLR